MSLCGERRKPSVSELEISKWTGPPLDSIWKEDHEASVEEQIVDALKRLGHYRQEYIVDLESEYKVKLVNPGALQMLGAKLAREAQKHLTLRKDPRYTVLSDQVSHLLAQKEEPPAAGVTKASENFRANFREQTKKLVGNLQEVQDSAGMARMLTQTYQWYRRQAEIEAGDAAYVDITDEASRKAAPPCFHLLQPEDLAADHTMPGSAFFGGGFAGPGDETGELEGGDSKTEVGGSGGVLGAFSAEGIPPQPYVPTLPPAHERLKGYDTKHVASPLSARRLTKLSALRSSCASPDMVDRPFTPSTATGGLTSRSMTPSTARSTPSPLPFAPSRPTSAASGYRRPTTAQGMRSATPWLPPRPASSMSFAGEAIPEAAAAGSVSARRRPAPPIPGQEVKEPMTDAELRMEERWLYYRNKEIADQLVAEERRAVVRDWAERRARVEEEIVRNAETARYQSEVARRGYHVPDDADEDIDAFSPAGASAAGGASPSSSSAAAARRARNAAKEVPKFDVRKVDKSSGRSQVRFCWDGGKSSPKAPKAPVSTRSAYLRNLHRKLIEPRDTSEATAGGNGAGESDDETDRFEDRDRFGEPGGERRGVGGGGGGAAGTEGAQGGSQQQRISLSPYAPDEDDLALTNGRELPLRREDDTDVIASVCKSWWRKGPVAGVAEGAQTAAGLEELRFQQLQEVEDIKRVFARSGRPMDAGVLERAMIMPMHRATGVGATMRGSNSHLPSNPFFKNASKKKKKPAKKAGKKKKA